MNSTNADTINASKGKSKAPSSSQSKKAGLEFPVGRIKRYMKEGKYANRIGAGAPVYLAAVMEYLAADLSIQVLELAGNQAEREKKNRITPSHIRFAVTADEELRGLCGGAMFPSASAPPKIHGDLLPKKSISNVFHRKPRAFYVVEEVLFQNIESTIPSQVIDAQNFFQIYDPSQFE